LGQKSRFWAARQSASLIGEGSTFWRRRGACKGGAEIIGLQGDRAGQRGFTICGLKFWENAPDTFRPKKIFGQVVRKSVEVPRPSGNFLSLRPRARLQKSGG
jgi:hypothetical protein